MDPARGMVQLLLILKGMLNNAFHCCTLVIYAVPAKGVKGYSRLRSSALLQTLRSATCPRKSASALLHSQYREPCPVATTAAAAAADKSNKAIEKSMH